MKKFLTVRNYFKQLLDINHNILKKTIFLDKSIEVLIVSSGGVGTTFLLDEIAKYKKVNIAKKMDGYKHLPIPPISSNKNLKVIYVFGDPILASISLFRRKYHHTQSHWVQKYHDSEFVIPENMTLDDYAKHQKNGHQFKQHLDNWRKKYPMYPTMFIKYEELYQSLDALVSFLELPSTFLENFPEKRARKSSIDKLSVDTAKGLHDIHSDYQKEVQQLPSYFINPPTTNQTFYFSKPYRRAFVEAFFKRFVLLRKMKNKIMSIFKSN